MTVEIDGANNIVKTNTISEVTSANGVTVDGLNIKDSKLVTADSVITTNITDANVTQGKIADQAINEAKMQISNAPTNGYALTAQSGNTGGMTWASVGGDNTPYFHVTKSADQAISTDSFTTVTFDSEIFDSGNNFASNTFTAPSTGYYFIYSQLVWSGTTNSDYSLNRLMKNGSPVNWIAFFQTNSSGAFGGRVISLSASDTVTVQCYQDSGGNLSLRGGSEDECQFGGFKLIT